MAHLHPSPFGAAVTCDACHEVPTTVAHSDGVVSVTFPSLPRPSGATPQWNRSAGTCSGVVCHGAALQGGPAATPAWTSTAALGCSSCHGNPPASHAAGSTDCSSCHSGTVNPDGTIWVANGLHMNGEVNAAGAHGQDWALPSQHGYSANASGLASCKTCHGAALTGGSGPSCASCHATSGFASWDTSCTFCHGNRSTGRASPPVDTQGRSATGNISVGVHDAHVGTTMATPIACGECHPARSASVITDAAHVDGDGIAEVALGALARTGGAPATYTRTGATPATCSSVYCHGRFTGGTSSSPSWTSTTQVSCTSCHGNPPGTGRHGKHVGSGSPAIVCADCHGNSGSGAAHVNGTKNVPLTSGAAWNGTGCGTFACHGKSHTSTLTW
jgi:predicted CxxxxCH...CXXCH cytochrome family protein